MFKKKITENHITRRQFSYSKGMISLEFTLRVDIKTELEVFKELLLKALEDIEQEIDK